jgi:hypothetical protein
MSRIIVRLALLTVLALLPAALQAAAGPTITDYRPLWQPVTTRAGQDRVAIRSFRRNGIPHYLLVDPNRLETAIIPAEQCTGMPEGGPLRRTPYMQAVERATAAPYKLQNQGLTRAEQPLSGWVLTVDLCPSRRPFERELFQALLSLPERAGSPVPVAIAISGLWLERHPAELDWLKDQVAQGRLAITWVNHSAHHPYAAGLPLEQNFLLTPGTDFRQEVLALEERLLANDLVPSPFFRFPGLVSSGTLLKQLRELGLIPLGSDAWLAKGEQPRPGSFILVHGNGNEPAGIARLLALFKSPARLPLLPLAGVVARPSSPAPLR